LSFAEAVARARRMAPEVAEARAALATDLANVDAARHAYLPTLGLDVHETLTHTGQRERYSDAALSDTNLGASVQADLTVLDFGRRGARLAAAAQQANAGMHGERGAELDASLRIAELYVTLIADLAAIEADDAHLVERERVLDGIAALVEKGLRPVLDRERARAESIRARAALDISRQRARHDRQLLALLLAYPPAQPIAIEAVPENACVDPDQIDHSVAQAEARDPSLASARADVARADAALQSEEANKYPVVTAAAGVSVSRSDVLSNPVDALPLSRTGPVLQTLNANVGLSLRYALLDLTVWDRAAAAKHELEQARSRLRTTRLTRERELLDTAQALRVALIDVARASEVERIATLAVDAEVKRYALGESSLLQLLDAERLSYEAHIDEIAARLAHDRACTRLQLLSRV
jgi:outer membrane protein TolC